MLANGKREAAASKRTMLDAFDLLESGAISLPDDVKESDLGATYTDGVLEAVVRRPASMPQPHHRRPGNRAA
jgi:hypothetical protein